MQRIVIEGRNTEAEERRLSPVAMSVVGREELDAYGDISILDVLQRVPGISIEGDTPKLRGMGPGYTRILLNGEPAPPGFSLDTLSPGEIERIEIIKGPTAEFGGVAGTINVILRSAPKVRQREWRAGVGYRSVAPQASSSFNWGDRIGALGLYLPISVYSWVNASQSRVQLASRLDGIDTRVQRVQSQDQSRGGGGNVGPRLDWKINGEDTLQWQAFLQRNASRSQNQRDTEAVFGPAPYSVQDLSTGHGQWELQRTQAQWVRKAEAGTRLELKAMAQGSLATGSGASQGLSPLGVPGIARSSLSSQRESSASVGARWRQPLGQDHTLSLGVDVDEKNRRELRRQFNDGDEQFTGSVGAPFTAVSQRSSAFGQDEWAMAEGWSSMLGLRGESTRLVTGGPSGEVANVYSVLSPVLHLRHALDTKGRDVVRASVARSIRVPEIALLLPRYTLNGSYDRDTPNTPLADDTAGNPRLQPEYATGFDLALEQHLRSGGVLSASVFHRRLDGLIRRRIALESVAEASVPRWVSRPANLGSARSTGIELEIKGQGNELLKPLWAGAPKTLQVRAAVSVYRSSVEQIDDPDARLEGQPPWTASVGFDHSLPAVGITCGSNFTLTPGFSTQQTDRQRVWRSAARRLDAYLLWRFDRLTNLRLAVNNAFPADSQTASQIDALDGTAAGSQSRRQGYTQYTANLQWRF